MITVVYEIAGRYEIAWLEKSDTDNIAPRSWDELAKIKHSSLTKPMQS
jgi:hypothetical protein